MSPAAIDLEGTFKSGGITSELVAAGVFDGARCYLFTTDFLNPVEDSEEIVCSTLGKATIEDDHYLVEEMALVDALNQPVGRLFMPACQKVFGGTEYAGCKKALGPLTVTGTITSAASGSSFADSSRAEAANYWTLGANYFTSGANAGLKRMEIRSFSFGAFVTYEPFPNVPVIGDTYTLIPGCGKSRDECRDKWANIDNFGGFPDMPPSSTYLSRGTK
jgi:uncharacterized phage protein (TIGR02218 family)